MRATTSAGIAAIACLLRAPEQQMDILMTIPQADRWRTAPVPASAAVSANGRYIALMSYAALVPADTDDGADVYVLDRDTGHVSLESLMADDRPLTGDNSHPRLSGDGRYLVFETAAFTLDGAPDTDIVLRDRVQDTATLLNRDAGRGGPRLSRRPAISEDGRLVVFSSAATDLVAGGDENGAQEDVYAFKTATRAIGRVSLDSRGIQRATGSSFAPSVSAEGRYVAFTSTADLDGAPAGPADARTIVVKPSKQVYVRDLELGITTRASVGTGGMPLDGASYEPAISRDGRYVAFVSEATNLAHGDRNRSPDIFVRDMRARSTAVITRAANGGTANGPSGTPAISSDGRFVAFQSRASDLVCMRRCAAALEDVNLVSDVFLFDRIGERMTRISEDAAGEWAEESGAPYLDAAANIVAFTSRHPIDERDALNDFDLFFRVRGRPAQRSAR